MGQRTTKNRTCTGLEPFFFFSSFFKNRDPQKFSIQNSNFWLFFCSSSCEEFWTKHLGDVEKNRLPLERFISNPSTPSSFPIVGFWTEIASCFFSPENTHHRIRSVLYETVDGSSIFGKQVGVGRKKPKTVGWLLLGVVDPEKKHWGGRFFVYKEYASGEDRCFFWEAFVESNTLYFVLSMILGWFCFSLLVCSGWWMNHVPFGMGVWKYESDRVGKKEVSILSLNSWLQDKFRKQGNTWELMHEGGAFLRQVHWLP